MDVIAGSGTRAWWRTARPALWSLATVVSLWPPSPRTLALAGGVVLGGVATVAAMRLTAPWWRLVLLALTALVGLVTIVLVPRALGEIPVLVVASVAPRLLPRRASLALAAVLTLAFAAAVVSASGTVLGALAGLAVPLLTARAADRVALQVERDRATALLAELEARRDADLHAAATEERARIARDLHDVLAHTLSGLSLHLQAARAVAARDGVRDPTLTDTIDRAADLARSGLDEARRAVAALRTGEPGPGAAELTALVDAHPDAELSVSGAFDALPAGVRRAAFATVRESLTNAGRHAPGAPVTVGATVGAHDAVVVRVHDEGAPAARPHEHGGGQGLAGLAERAALVGGRVDAGPDGTGWTVTLRVPEADR